jgi:hypothetical protein
MVIHALGKAFRVAKPLILNSLAMSILNSSRGIISVKAWMGRADGLTIL